MTSETIANDPNSANGALNYSLDAVGNRLSRTSTLAGISSTTSTYNANDRLNSDGYDANGNTTSADGKTYAYNFENRIKTVDGGALTFVYDGDGNRVAKTVAGLTTKYLVDELNPTGYAQVTEEVAGGSVQRTYTYGNALVSQNQLGNSQTSFYGSDAHGSVRLLTNSAGTVSDTYDYEAFGNLVSASGTTPNDYLYSGERFDSDLGAYHLRERDYNPQRGRFLTTDPFAGFTDLPRTLHKYLYVGADPVNYLDPSGLTETTEYRLNIVRLNLRTKLPRIRALLAVSFSAPPIIPNAGGVIRSFVSSKAETYYRVFSGDRKVGGFLFKAIPKSRTLARLAGSLPPWNQAHFIQEVLVPAGTRLQRSRALPAYGGCGSLEQFQLLTDIALDSFGAGVPFL